MFAARLSTAQRHISVGDVPVRCISQGAPPFVGPLPPLELLACRPGLGNLAHLRFFDPSHFRAGNIHYKLSLWQDLLKKSYCSEVDILEVVRDGVRVDRFFKPLRANFKGQAYNSEYPRPVIIKNSPTTAKFSQFVSDSIIQWVTAGGHSCFNWGAVDSVAPPRLFLPLTVEPSKPRLCHDERYLNLWIRDLPFKLDHLCDLPRYVLPVTFSGMDCILSERDWEQVERLFGPHTFDLMSLDTNCQHDGTGQCLPHFTHCATPSSSGINVLHGLCLRTTTCMYSRHLF